MIKIKLIDHILQEEVARYKIVEDVYKKNTEGLGIDMDELGEQLARIEQSAHIDSISNEETKKLLLHRRNIKTLEKLRDEAYTRVQKGALVKMNNEYYFVAITKQSFKIDGNTIHGLSEDDELYQHMYNKRAGNSFILYGKIYSIQEVS